MELGSNGRVEFKALRQWGDKWSGRCWRGLSPACGCLLGENSMKGVRESWNAQLHLVVAKLVAHELDGLFFIAVSGFDKFNYLRKRDIAAEKGIEAKWDSRLIPFVALS